MDDDALVTWHTAPPYDPKNTVEQGCWPHLVHFDARLAAITPDYRIRGIQPSAGRHELDIDETTAGDDGLGAIRAAGDEATRTRGVCGRPVSPRRRGSALYAVLCEDDAGSATTPPTSAPEHQPRSVSARPTHRNGQGPDVQQASPKQVSDGA